MEFHTRSIMQRNELVGNDEPFNRDLQLTELKTALASDNVNTALGADCISCAFYRHLSDRSLLKILKFYNLIWLSGQYPSKWKESPVVPMLKMGKDKTQPNSYRPMAQPLLYANFRFYNIWGGTIYLDNNENGHWTLWESTVDFAEGYHWGSSRRTPCCILLNYLFQVF